MNTKLILGVVKVVLPRILGRITGLAGYRDQGKTGALSGLFDGSKFVAVVVVLAGLGLSMLPVEVRTALLEVVAILLAPEAVATAVGG